MILLAPFDAGDIYMKKGMFISSEMVKVLADKVREGSLDLNTQMTPVLLPYDTLGGVSGVNENPAPNIDMKTWNELGLPPMYHGENLDRKKLIVFPMHGLGDQLYLAMALRHLVSLFSGTEVYIVKPSIKSSEQWYGYIYFDRFFHITGPVVSIEEMGAYDYFVDAEHFAHMEEYKGVYPPEFYLKYLFYHDPVTLSNMQPKIGPPPLDNGTYKSLVDKRIVPLRSFNKPIVFVNSMTTGRVRDIPMEAVLSFVKQAERDYSFVVSTFNNESLAFEIMKMEKPHIVTTDGCIDTIDGLIYLLSKMDYVVTSDSGITHLSEALGIPCGSVFNVVTPEERTGSYRFSEEMMVDFHIDGVCQTPCYVHALYDNQECPGMAWANANEGQKAFRRYAPCMNHFKGEHLLALLESLTSKFPVADKDPLVLEADAIIEKNVFRKDVYDIVPEGASRILDFGCHQAELLLKLKRDKKCTGLYGIEINPSSQTIFDRHLDKGWIMDMSRDDAVLGEEYLDYFNYIIMHDVVEHLYDPWYVVEKMRQYLAPEGKLVMVVPNIQYWGILNQIFHGDFPYGAGGLLNEDHIRWFTCRSICELALMAGYDIDYFLPMFPHETDVSGYSSGSNKSKLSFPPEENRAHSPADIHIDLINDIQKNYYLFLANKILLVCRNTQKPIHLKRVAVGELRKRKESLNIDFHVKMS